MFFLFVSFFICHFSFFSFDFMLGVCIFVMFVCFLISVHVSKHAVDRLSHIHNSKVIHRCFLRVVFSFAVFFCRCCCCFIIIVLYVTSFYTSSSSKQKKKEKKDCLPEMRIIAIASSNDNDMVDDFSVGLSDS